MNDFKISEDIYQEALSQQNDSYKISDDIYEESVSLTLENVKEKLIDSYKMSGRYWIWRMGNYSYCHDWERMYSEGEMQVEAPGLKYLKSYPNLTALENDYRNKHLDNLGVAIFPPAYWAFAYSLREGDVVLACRTATSFFAWGIVDSPYMFSILRKKGRHYRTMTWIKMDMPFIFNNKKPALFQIDKEETNHLKEALINKIVYDSEKLPFEFLVKQK